MAEPLSDCFTCWRKTDNFLEICDESNTECVDQVLARHFWFRRSDLEQAVLCTTCWERIGEFHKFYCEVANLHNRDISLLSEVKEEPEVFVESPSPVESKPPPVKGKRGRKRKVQPVDEEELEVPQFNEEEVMVLPIELQVKFEVSDNEDQDDEGVEPKQEFEMEQDSMDSGSEDDFIGSEEEESDEESSKPIASRKRRAKRTTVRKTRQKPVSAKEKDAFIRKHFDQLPCEECEEVFTSFGQLDKHCRKAHDAQASIVCCNRQYHKRLTLYQHLCRHKNIYKFHCKQCDRSFKNVDGLNMHNLLLHTPEEEKRFRCQQCNTAFATEVLLTSHLNWHATVEPKNIVCKSCNKYFTNVKMLENHSQTHHPELLFTPEGEFGFQPTEELEDPTNDHESPRAESSADKETTGSKKPRQLIKPCRRKTPEELALEDELIRKYCPLSCEQCAYTVDTFSKLDMHYKSAHGIRGYAICCTRKFDKKSRLYEHVCVHENPEHFKCEVCAKTFQNSFGLSNHMMWKHTPDSEKPFRCDVCGNRFWKDYLLKQHMDYHLALEEKRYQCKECSRHFGTSLLLKSHEQTIHGLSASWVCDICARGFSLKSALEFHRQQHTQEGRAAMKAQCENCKLWLKNIRSLRSHMNRCNSDPVSCEICGKECSNRYSLQGHKKFVHENTTTYSCSFCAKPFKRLLRLKEHEAGHTGDLLYKCEYCPRTCNSSSNMYTHKKVSHPEQWAEKMASRFHQR